MHYTYGLLSSKHGEWYTGAASEGKTRLRDHEQGRVAPTRFRRPLRLIDYEACLEPVDAYRRERYLKTGKGFTTTTFARGWLHNSPRSGWKSWNGLGGSAEPPVLKLEWPN